MSSLFFKGKLVKHEIHWNGMFGHDKERNIDYYSLMQVMQAAPILPSANVSLSGAQSAEHAVFGLGEGLRAPMHRAQGVVAAAGRPWRSGAGK
jgi:hypothetical protein